MLDLSRSFLAWSFLLIAAGGCFAQGGENSYFTYNGWVSTNCEDESGASGIHQSFLHVRPFCSLLAPCPGYDYYTTTVDPSGYFSIDIPREFQGTHYGYFITTFATGYSFLPAYGPDANTQFCINPE